MPDDTVLSQVGRAVYGDGTFFYFALQIATMAILVLGANTSYAGFPRLSSVLARDGLMPRQFANRGDRLVFSNGIIGLTVVAVVIIVIFEADTHRMIPFYALGVFVGFTLSQAGMVMHWRRLGTEDWQRKGGYERRRRRPDRRRRCRAAADQVRRGRLDRGRGRAAAGRRFLRDQEALRPGGPGSGAAEWHGVDRFGEAAGAVPRTTVVFFVAQVNVMTARALAVARALSPESLQAVTISNDPERPSACRNRGTTWGLTSRCRCRWSTLRTGSSSGRP